MKLEDMDTIKSLIVDALLDGYEMVVYKNIRANNLYMTKNLLSYRLIMWNSKKRRYIPEKNERQQIYTYKRTADLIDKKYKKIVVDRNECKILRDKIYGPD